MAQLGGRENWKCWTSSRGCCNSCETSLRRVEDWALETYYQRRCPRLRYFQLGVRKALSLGFLRLAVHGAWLLVLCLLGHCSELGDLDSKIHEIHILINNQRGFALSYTWDVSITIVAPKSLIWMFLNERELIVQMMILGQAKVLWPPNLSSTLQNDLFREYKLFYTFLLLANSSLSYEILILMNWRWK
jgi:hypothetical protein